MERDTASELLRVVSDVAGMLDAVPHGVAKKISALLQDVSTIADDVFPGGYAGKCSYCDAHIGHDESVAIGGEYYCQPCWSKRLDEIKSCDHDMQDGADEFGDKTRFCRQCGYETA